jgi:hypothetical protein
MPKSKMPVLFIGHGSPMNALEDNPFTKTLVRLGNELSNPRRFFVFLLIGLQPEPGLVIRHTPKPFTIFIIFPNNYLRFSTRRLVSTQAYISQSEYPHY